MNTDKTNLNISYYKYEYFLLFLVKSLPRQVTLVFRFHFGFNVIIFTLGFKMISFKFQIIIFKFL